jgi:hypothetical protein
VPFGYLGSRPANPHFSKGLPDFLEKRRSLRPIIPLTESFCWANITERKSLLDAEDVEGRSDVIRYRHKAHNTFIRDNGAIKIQDVDGKVLFEKLGSDGRGVEL